MILSRIREIKAWKSAGDVGHTWRGNAHIIVVLSWRKGNTASWKSTNTAKQTSSHSEVDFAQGGQHSAMATRSVQFSVALLQL